MTWIRLAFMFYFLTVAHYSSFMTHVVKLFWGLWRHNWTVPITSKAFVVQKSETLALNYLEITLFILINATPINASFLFPNGKNDQTPSKSTLLLSMPREIVFSDCGIFWVSSLTSLDLFFAKDRLKNCIFGLMNRTSTKALIRK